MIKPIIDMCCGSRMFWRDKKNPKVEFCDIRKEEHTLCDGRKLVVSPDRIEDFRCLSFDDESFDIVVFDPPHLVRAGDNSWMKHKYGRLDKETWSRDIAAGFSEARRVLRGGGTLVFKWNETQIPASKVGALTNGWDPLITQRVGKNDKTHWMIFYKGRE